MSVLLRTREHWKNAHSSLWTTEGGGEESGAVQRETERTAEKSKHVKFPYQNCIQGKSKNSCTSNFSCNIIFFLLSLSLKASWRRPRRQRSPSIRKH